MLLEGVDALADAELVSSDDSMFAESDESMKLLTGVDSEYDLGLQAGVLDDDDEPSLLLSDSDSDVRLDESSPDSSILAAGGELQEEDSEIFLDIDSDSDVHLVDSLSVTDDSDSDVMLNSVGSATESDIRLMDGPGAGDMGATMAMDLPEDSDLKLIDSRSTADGDDSGISLEFDEGMLSFDADESGISLEIDDSGISLEADYSGISLESLDSGALLGDDSGISLDLDDSGLTLEAADSGIALFDDDSGISLDADDLGHTQPMAALGGGRGIDLGKSSANTTEMRLPEPGDNDSEFELAGLDDDDDDFGTDTSVLMFDDDDAGDEFSVASQKSVSNDDLDVADFDADDSFEDDLGDDWYDDDFEDEEMDDVWDAEDEDSDDGFDTGESKVGGFAAPAGAAMAAGRMVQDQPWGALWTSFVSVGAVLSVLSAFVGIELVRTMWLWTQPGEPTSGLLGMLGGLFGK